MPSPTPEQSIIGPDDLILVTGAAGFIGGRVIDSLIARGYRRIRCFTRPSSNPAALSRLKSRGTDAVQIEIVSGNLLSKADCAAAATGASVVYHLAAGRGEKSIPDAFMNSVVTTRNLLDALLDRGSLKRFVSVSSFSVYSNDGGGRRGLLDEDSPMETQPELRGDAYSFAKVKQDELVMDYGKRFQVPYTIVRPGFVYGAGNEGITGRIGIGSFGIFLHLGGSNPIPLSYVDNCADAIVLAGLKPGLGGEIFNVVDDDLPTSREFLRLYKRHVRKFQTIYLPKPLSYILCFAWEKYSSWSQGQLPPTFNRRVWHAYWKKTRYTNAKLKGRLEWRPRVSTKDALERFFESCRRKREAQN